MKNFQSVIDTSTRDNEDDVNLMETPTSSRNSPIEVNEIKTDADNELINFPTSNLLSKVI